MPDSETNVLSLIDDAGETNALYAIMSFLSPLELSRVVGVNKTWYATGTTFGLWKQKVKELWEDKAYIPKEFRELVSTDPFRAYALSVADSKRQWIKDEELCSLTWYRRMKKCAGDHWIESDPYWQGKPQNTSAYSADGTLLFIHTKGFSHPLQEPGEEAPVLKWRWVSSSCGREGPRGQFLRASRNGRDFPTMVVHRHSNWGFVMQNCWAVAASFELPPPGEEPALDDDALDVTVEAQNSEAMGYNLGIPNVDGEGGGGVQSIFSELLSNLRCAREDEATSAVRARIAARGAGGAGDAGGAEEGGDEGGGVGEEPHVPPHGPVHPREGPHGEEEGPVSSRTRSAAGGGAPGSGGEGGATNAAESASQWLQDFDSRWDRFKRRFDTVMSASLVQFAAGLSQDPTAEAVAAEAVADAVESARVAREEWEAGEAERNVILGRSSSARDAATASEE